MAIPELTPGNYSCRRNSELAAHNDLRAVAVELGLVNPVVTWAAGYQVGIGGMNSSRPARHSQVCPPDRVLGRRIY